MNQALHQITAFALCALLTACGGGGSSDGDSGSDFISGNDIIPGSTGPGATQSALSLRLTDAPVDDVVAVVMEFTAVALRKKSGDWINFPFSSLKSIDVLQLQGTLTADLLVDVPVDIGLYDEIRLLVSEAPMANYLDLGSAGLVDLKIPGGSSSGLKIKGEFMVFKSRPTSLVLDFDLRQSIKRKGKSGIYSINPVIRLANSENSGHLRGTVNPAQLSSITACSDDNIDTFNALYVYAGHDVIPDDINQSSTTDANPITTTTIKYDPKSITYKYEVAFLPAGDYTIAVTCNSNLDDLDAGNDDLRFFNIRNVSVTSNGTVAVF